MSDPSILFHTTQVSPVWVILASFQVGSSVDLILRFEAPQHLVILRHISDRGSKISLLGMCASSTHAESVLKRRTEKSLFLFYYSPLIFRAGQSLSVCSGAQKIPLKSSTTLIIIQNECTVAHLSIGSTAQQGLISSFFH